MTARALLAAVAVVAAGCVPAEEPPRTAATPVRAEDIGSTPVPLLDERFFADPPSCVVVRAVDWPGGHDLPRLAVERSAARHLSDRVERVVGPDEAEVLSRRLAIGLATPRDRADFRHLTGCGHVLEIRATGPASEHRGLWAERRVGLDLRLVAIGDEQVLWSTAGTAVRGDGGMPFSVFGAIGAAVRAESFWADPDVPVSVLDDLLRRLLRGLPDSRRFGRAPLAYAAGRSMNSMVMPSGSRR